MDKEIKSKAIELSDEELQDISGGKALIFATNGDSRWVVLCDYYSLSEFKSRYNSQFVNNGCPQYKGSGYASCGKCSNHHNVGHYPSYATDAFILSDIESKGYTGYEH